MLNLKTLLENPEGTKAALTKRNMGADGRLAVDEIVHLGARRRDLVQRTEELRRTRNEKSALIGRVRSGRAEPDEGLDLDELIADVGGIKGELKTIETELNQVQERLAHYLDTLPNVLDDSVPKGETDEENIVERTWGTPRAFDFVPKDHKMLGETLGILDLARGARLTGSGFPLLRGVGARLERALINFMLDIHTTEHGYMEHWVPFAVNRDTMRGTGQLPKFEKDLYWAEDGALGLIPTAEVPLTNIHKGEILPENALPMNFTAFSPCFRQEAGQHGEETRGLIRVHQFSKVELVKIVHPDHSVEELEKLTANAELILQRLGLPYRVVTLCWETPASAPPRPTISRCGCPARRSTGRSAPAATAPTSRPAG